MSTLRRRFIVAGLPLLLAGCVDTASEGDGKVYTMQAWVPMMFIVGGLVAVGIAWRMRKTQRLVGLGVGLIGVAVVVVGVGTFGDRLKVDAEHFDLKTGFQWSPTVHHVKFADLTRIDITSEKRRTRRGSSTSYYLICHRKSGGSEKVPAGDMMKEALGYIIEQAQKANVAVQNFTDQ